MKNRGFTLIELVVTISLLSILGVMIATNMIGLQSKQLSKDYESYKEKIADAACSYIESDGMITFYKNLSLSEKIISKKECLNNGGCFVNTNTLITEGYLDDTIKNPTTGKYVSNNEIVKVYFDEGIKKCEYQS